VDSASAGHAHWFLRTRARKRGARVAAGFARRAGVWGFWFGANLLVALLSVVSAVAVPGASYLLLLAAWAAGLAAVLPCLYLARGRIPHAGRG